MSNPESFIDEVNEDLRRDRLFAFFRKWSGAVALGVVLIVGAAGWTEWRKAQAEAAAQAFGDAVIAALDGETPAARSEALAAIDASGARAGVLNLLLAATRIEAEDRPGALAALAAVEADATLPTSLRQIATLKRVVLAGADLPAAEREAALTALATPGQPLRPLALEQLVLLAMETGQTQSAIDQAQALLQEADVSALLRQRIEQILIILGGAPAPIQG